MEALRKIAVCSPDRLEDVLWFHDADFDVDDISLDEEKETRTIVFDQAVDQLPDDLELPRPDVEKRGRLRYRERMPFVECELVIREASRFDLDDDETWGMLSDASFDPARRVVRISSVIGPTSMST
jgi:hypothetical protein